MSARLTTLESGLRVATDTMASVETASVGAWIEVGTRHEPADRNGISHVLEHMAFKGTRRRDARAIAEAMDAVGGHLNAYTSHEHTAYYAKILKADLGLAVDIIADILQNAVFDSEELERESAVIVQEIRHANDTPDDCVFDHFQHTAFPDQGIGRPVMGTEALVRSMDRDALVDFLRCHYSAPRMVVAGAGNVDHDALVALVDEAFAAPAITDGSGAETPRYAGGEFRESRPLEQVHEVLGFEGVGYRDPDFYALAVFSTLFGGGMSSRLFQEIREKRGLAYSVYSFSSAFTDCGLFGIYAGTGETQAAEVLGLVTDELRAACDRVGADEVARARAQIKSGILMSLESTSARCEQLARQLMVFGRAIPIAETIERVEAVDADAVARVARRIAASPPTLAVLGPANGLPSVDRVAERLN